MALADAMPLLLEVATKWAICAPGRGYARIAAPGLKSCATAHLVADVRPTGERQPRGKP
jgi:hypothetical protein